MFDCCSWRSARRCATITKAPGPPGADCMAAGPSLVTPNPKPSFAGAPEPSCAGAEPCGRYCTQAPAALAGPAACGPLPMAPAAEVVLRAAAPPARLAPLPSLSSLPTLKALVAAAVSPAVVPTALMSVVAMPPLLAGLCPNPALLPSARGAAHTPAQAGLIGAGSCPCSCADAW